MGLGPFIAVNPGSILGQGTKDPESTSCATWPKKKEREKEEKGYRRTYQVCQVQENHPPYGLCDKPQGGCVIKMHDNRDAEARGALFIWLPRDSSAVGRIKKTMLSLVGAEG